LRKDWTAPGLFVAREPFSPPESAFPLVRDQAGDQGSPAAMTLDASTQSTPTAMISVASALQIPVIFGAEVRWDFLVAPAGKPDQTNACFDLIRHRARQVQLRGKRRSGSFWQRPRTAGLIKRHKHDPLRRKGSRLARLRDWPLPLKICGQIATAIGRFAGSLEKPNV
jgi:hypothetical protein